MYFFQLWLFHPPYAKQTSYSYHYRVFKLLNTLFWHGIHYIRLHSHTHELTHTVKINIAQVSNCECTIQLQL